MALIPPAEYLPDQPIFNGGAGEALNVTPDSRSYRPLQSLAAYSTTPLTARAQGAAYFRDESTAHLPVQVAGDATKLYLLVATVWTDASRLAGGAYTTGGDFEWVFAQFTNIAIAVNGADDPQKLDISATPGSNFVVLGGSPPTGPAFVAIVGDFVMLAHFPTNSRLIVWSALADGEDYVASAVTQSDSQEVPDGGIITGLYGYEYGAVILQADCIRRADYEGSPLIFRLKKIADGVGATIKGSVAGFGDRLFFWHRSGAFMLVGGAQLVPIGAGKVDRFFWADLDQVFLDRVTSAIDPINKIWAILYSPNGANGAMTRMLIFHWDTGRWSRGEPGELEMIYSGTIHTGLTLDELDVYGTLDSLPFSLDSPVWSGVPTPIFAGFDTSHNLGFFNGAALAATVDTLEMQLIDGKRARARSLRPMVEGTATPSVALGWRNLLSEAVTWTSAVLANLQGFCRFNRRARYHRARITMQAGDDWQQIVGVDEIEAKAAGKR